MRKIMFRFMPDCEQASELQWQELDASLSSREKRGLRNHLMVCRRCSEYRKKLHTVRDELNQSGATPLSRSYKMSSEAFERLKASVSANSEA